MVTGNKTAYYNYKKNLGKALKIMNKKKLGVVVVLKINILQVWLLMEI